MDNKELTEVAEKTVKQRRPKRSEQLSVHTEPGDNTKYLKHSMEIASLPKIDIKDAEQVKKRINEYFTICCGSDMKPSMAGLALAIGISRQTLWEWANDVVRKGEFGDAIKKAVQMLDLQMVDYMQNGKINPVSGIFLMKNNFGYTDKTEVVVTPNNPLGDEVEQKALEDKYMNSVIDADGVIIDEDE